SLISAALVIGLAWACLRGLSLGKWVHNVGALAMFLVYAALILLPLVGLARGELKSYHPLQLALPTMSIFYCFNIFTKLAVGALSGFEYVAILAGETRSPARDIGRSVLIASPVIALMFILGTSSVLAFIGEAPIDLIGPVPQTLRLGLRSFPIAGAIASIGILLMTTRTIASTSVHVTGSSRLPSPARSVRESRKRFNLSITRRTFSTELFTSPCSPYRSSARPRFVPELPSGYGSQPSAAQPSPCARFTLPSTRLS